MSRLATCLDFSAGIRATLIGLVYLAKWAVVLALG